MRAAIQSVLVLTLILSTAAAVAQQAVEFDRYEVHYSSLNTNMLSPDVASVRARRPCSM